MVPFSGVVAPFHSVSDIPPAFPGGSIRLAWSQPPHIGGDKFILQETGKNGNWLLGRGPINWGALRRKALWLALGYT
jgi:hypothetical protein